MQSEKKRKAMRTSYFSGLKKHTILYYYNKKEINNNKDKVIYSVQENAVDESYVSLLRLN
jgi:tRNA A37 threonylcarbamoyltransferase TsaD